MGAPEYQRIACLEMEWEFPLHFEGYQGVSNSARPQNGVGIPTPFWGRAELDIADFIDFLLFSAEKVCGSIKRRSGENCP